MTRAAALTREVHLFARHSLNNSRLRDSTADLIKPNSPSELRTYLRVSVFNRGLDRIFLHLTLHS